MSELDRRDGGLDFKLRGERYTELHASSDGTMHEVSVYEEEISG